MLLLTEAKQFSNLLNIKKEKGVTLLVAISLIRYVMAALEQNPVLKIPISLATTSNSHFSILHMMGS